MQGKDQYRGKRVIDGLWIKGMVFQLSQKFNPSIMLADRYGESYEVIEDTVRQSTGLLDKNLFTIFEGDILRLLYTDWPSKDDNDPRTLEEYLRDIAIVGVVRWNDTYARYEFRYGPELQYSGSLEPGTHGYREVIGNIWDNKELLEDSNKRGF